MHKHLVNVIDYFHGLVDTLKKNIVIPVSSTFFYQKKRASDIRKRQIFADIDKHAEMFTSEKKELFDRRNAWLEKNPEYSHPDLRQFDTHAYPGENILVISPHPDDEIIGCGGTLIKLREAGSKISVLQLTDGSKTSALQDSPEHIRKTIRLKEAETVAADLGAANLFLFREVDSQLQSTAKNVKKLSGILNTLQPMIIFIPFMNDKHPDHVVANEILGKALESSALDLKKVHILSYEVWNFVPLNSYCCIDRQFDKKTKMLRKYRTAMKVIDYVKFCESLNSYHAFILLGKKGFAEVFLDIDAERYRQLVRDSEIPR
jgi:LmbE family N-acetylglucosaminyl deacetylase